MAEADCKEGWKEMQERTFTKWFNSILALGEPANGQITSLQKDLQDGLKLIQLLEILMEKKFDGIHKRPTREYQRLENLKIFFEHLNKAEVKVVNIGPKDVYDGNMKLILGLIWALILHFQISAHGHSIDSKQLLAWVQAQIPDQDVKNFTTDWNDGVALCALVNSIEPDLCPNYSTLDCKQNLENCSRGIKLAKEELEIVKIIEAEDLCDPNVDNQSVMTYVSLFCKPANKCLLEWVQGKLPDRKEGIKNLNTDWQDGVNLAGLLDTLKPGCFPNWRELDPKMASENLTEVMKIGEEQFGVKPFTITDGRVDELSLATYLTHLQRSATSIPDSPHTVKVTYDATQFAAQGEGLKEAIAHRPAKFVVKGPQSGLPEEDMLQVKIKGGQYESKMVSKEEFNPASEEALVCKTETQKGTYVVEYSVPSHGNFTVHVTIDDQDIPKSPFSIKVHPDADPTQCKVFGNAIEHPHSLVLRKNIEFKVDATKAGTGELTAMATDPTSSEIKVISKPDSKNKVYELKVNPKMIGEHNIAVYWNNEHIPDSPFSFDICDPSKIKVCNLPDASSYSAEVEKPLTFLVNAKKAGKGQLKCTVKVKSTQDDQPREIPVEPRLQDDGNYVLEFIPQEIGQMQLDLTYNDTNIIPRPWECEISKPVPTQVRLLSNNSHEKQNHPVKFEVSGLTKRMANKLKIIVNHPQHKNPKPQKEQLQEGGIVYHFTPQQLGKYTVSAKIDGKDIHGSPFSVKVVNPEACILKGEIPTILFMQKRKQFAIDTSKAGPGELSWKIENQESSDQSSTPKLSCETISTDPDNARVEVSGLESGECKLFLKWGGYNIQNMPLNIAIYDPSQCSYKCATGRVKTGDKVSVFIDTTKAGGCKPIIKANGVSMEYRVELEKISEGEYKASFIPHEDGQQNVEIFVGDVMLPKCPLTFKTSKDADEHDASVTFTIGVETNDTDTCKLHMKVVNPKKRYRVRVKEEKPGEWKTVCTAEEEEEEQEIHVLCSESELVGHPIKISVSDQKKSSGLHFCKVFLLIIVIVLALLMLFVIATSSISTTGPEVKPI